MGDAVFASLFDLGTGSLAEIAVVPESAAALKPANLDFVQAASIPMVGLTAWQAVKERAQPSPGQKVFIPAGSGGIGTCAIQLAKHLGARVGTTTSTGNVDLVRNLGAVEVINCKKQEFEEVLRNYDVALGTVRGKALKKSLQILKSNSSVIPLVGPLRGRLHPRSWHEFPHEVCARLAEWRHNPESQQKRGPVFIPWRAARQSATRRNRRASPGGKNPAGD